MGALVSPKKYSEFVLVTTERLILWAQAMAVNPEVTHYIPPLTFQPRQTLLLKRRRRQPQPTNHCQTNPVHGTVPNPESASGLDPLLSRIPPKPMGYQAPFMYNSYPPHYYGHPPPPMGAQFGYPPNQVSPGLLGGHPKLNQSSRRDHQSIFANSIEGGCRLRTVPQIYIRQPLAGSSPKGFKKAHAQALTSRIGRFEHHLKKTRANNNEA
ncbi:hypothetical protein PSHT_11908 [Puccinia striiformis]|uniref:Uncharacterized protein n=1 Tax=Puccinia striiformis TaxID=27350 RepID=A0A2S4V049_9BASI|nr:hypothetical protein PSHT_11908 [Puccinia striiformis]